MNRFIIVLFFIFSWNFGFNLYAQEIELDSDYCDWYFSIGKSSKQYRAIVPGSNVNDLICNRLIPDPYVNNNIQNLKWIEDSLFTYTTLFNLNLNNEIQYTITFEGLDTYAKVWLNNEFIIKSNSMFISYQKDVTTLLRNGTNILKIEFYSAAQIGLKQALQSNIIYPADNENTEYKISPFVRKAAFQFGWDINPRLLSCGIWKPVKITTNKKGHTEINKLPEPTVEPMYHLKQLNDNYGQSFSFYTSNNTQNPKAIYGANYVPYNMYPLPVKTYKRTSDLQKNQIRPNRYEYYQQIFEQLHRFGCNMLRIWGGGWYEDDYFYQLADSFNIAIWHDFMFANTMYPGDKEWLNIVDTEIEQQIKRLSKFKCISLWCGNNEIDVAWKNWGWQKKYNYNKKDSLFLINNYKILFDSLIPLKLKNLNSKVSYLPSSPVSNWGNSVDFTLGDNHHWGIWHGEKPLEDYQKNIPRFASEYGIPSLSNNSLYQQYLPGLNCNHKEDTLLFQRMLSYKSIKLILRYIETYFDTPKNIEELIYASQYIQNKALKLAFNAHLINFPYCSGSLFWQFNESWPGITWAALDFSLQAKIPPYFSDYLLNKKDDKHYVIRTNPIIKEPINTDKILISLCNLNNSTVQTKELLINAEQLKNEGISFQAIEAEQSNKQYLKIQLINSVVNQIIWDTVILLIPEKELKLEQPQIEIKKLNEHQISITCNNTLAPALFLQSINRKKLTFDKNFIMLQAQETQVINVSHKQETWDIQDIRFYSLFDYGKGNK